MFQLLSGFAPQTDIGAVNTINTFAEPRNSAGEDVNTTVPATARTNSINSWAEKRNAAGLPVNSNATTSG